MGANPLSLGLAGGSAGLNYLNERSANKARKSALSQSIAQRAARQNEANSAINDSLASLAAGGSTAPIDYTAAVKAAMPQATAGLNQAGAVSDAYKTGADAAAKAIGDYGMTTAGLMSRIDTPTLQRQQEGMAMSQLRSTLGNIQRKAASDDYLANLRQQDIQANPWVSLASGLMGMGAGVAARSGVNDPTAYSVVRQKIPVYNAFGG